MITVSGWCEGAAGGYRGFEKDFFPNSLRFLEKNAVTMEARGIFQYSANPTEKVDPILRR